MSRIDLHLIGDRIVSTTGSICESTGALAERAGVAPGHVIHVCLVVDADTTTWRKGALVVPDDKDS